MIATSIRRRGENAWQVRIGSGKLQHSIGTYKTLKEAEEAKQTAILENENSVNSNNYKHITELAKQISEEAVRERKELIFNFLLKETTSSQELFEKVSKIKNLADSDILKLIEFMDNTEDNSESFELSVFMTRFACPPTSEDYSKEVFEKMTEREKLSLYNCFFDNAKKTDNITFDNWLKSLSEEELSRLNIWLYVHNWTN